MGVLWVWPPVPSSCGPLLAVVGGPVFVMGGSLLGAALRLAWSGSVACCGGVGGTLFAPAVGPVDAAPRFACAESAVVVRWFRGPVCVAPVLPQQQAGAGLSGVVFCPAWRLARLALFARPTCVVFLVHRGSSPPSTPPRTVDDPKWSLASYSSFSSSSPHPLPHFSCPHASLGTRSCFSPGVPRDCARYAFNSPLRPGPRPLGLRLGPLCDSLCPVPDARVLVTGDTAAPFPAAPAVPL